MKSKISFFNRGISRNLLRRFWPLWAAWLVFLLLLVPGSLSGTADMIRRGFEQSLNIELIRISLSLVFFAAPVSVAAAMAMFHYLYQSRSCGMMNALPLRRETMFSTAYWTGLVPLLLAEIFTALLTALLYCPGGLLRLTTALDFLALTALATVAFYGLAVFCGMLTGNLLVLPVLFVLLGLSAAVAEGCARCLLEAFVYGMRRPSLSFGFLAPLYQLARILNYDVPEEDSYRIIGYGLLAAYGAAGLVLSFVSLLLYRRRRMEAATDTVAIPVLKPAFKYCMSLGTALVLAYVMLQYFITLPVNGRANAWIVLGLMLVGAFLGYFAAEMLIQKTLRVFHRGWRGLAAACAVVAVFVLAFRFDLFGYERRVPAAENVEQVIVECMGKEARLTEKENIAAALDFHRDVLAARGRDRSYDDGSYSVQLSYSLGGEKVMLRSYLLTRTADDALVREAEALLNCHEAILARVVKELPVEEQFIDSAEVEYGQWYPRMDTGEEDFGFSTLELTRAEAMSLYREGVLPDAEADAIGRVHLVTDKAYAGSTYPLTIRIDLREPDRQGYTPYYFIIVDVEKDSVNTLRWLREHTQLELKTWEDWGVSTDFDYYG